MVYQDNPGEFAPVAESAYCSAGVLHVMLLHTDAATGVLSIFGGAPRRGGGDKLWDDLAFYRLKAAGNLVVSAVREGGSARWVALGSAAGGTFAVAVPGDAAWADPAKPPSVSPAAVPVTAAKASVAGHAVWEVTLAPGQTAVLFVGDAGAQGKFTIAPLPAKASELNYFGFRRQMQPLH